MINNASYFNFLEINNETEFLKAAHTTFNFQYHQNIIYQQWCNAVVFNDSKALPTALSTIPFLPINFFKTHQVSTTQFNAVHTFESSGTTKTINSKHYVKDINAYIQSFSKIFEIFYGDISNYCILGLLPSYLERNNSSLVMMVQYLIEKSKHKKSGFYLNNFNALNDTLLLLENTKQKTLLIGVTFALLDFAASHPIHLQHTTVIETGGMKGRRKELTRNEVHDILKQAFNKPTIHSEYGMTELFSQAYSFKDGRFYCPPWMKVLVRDEDDPLHIHLTGKGCLNIIDLANQYSCSFIATDDVGIVYEDGSFEVLGRVDNSDIRGCSLMVG